MYTSLTMYCIYNLCYPGTVNSLVPGMCGCNTKLSIFKRLPKIDNLSIPFEIAVMPQQYVTDGKSTLVQVMAWCRQATSHNLSLYWPRSLSPYGITRPRWVNAGINLLTWFCRLVNTLTTQLADIQSSVVITRSNIRWYCTHHCCDWGKVWISLNPQNTYHTSP